MIETLKNNRGQSIVEFTLIIPLIFVLIFAMLETGRFVHAAYEVEHASREAAREGALGGSDSQIIVRASTSAIGLDAGRLTVVINPTQNNRNSGDQLTVTVTYQFMPVTPFVGAIYTNGMNITSDMTMRVE